MWEPAENCQLSPALLFLGKQKSSSHSGSDGHPLPLRGEGTKASICASSDACPQMRPTQARHQEDTWHSVLTPACLSGWLSSLLTGIGGRGPGDEEAYPKVQDSQAHSTFAQSCTTMLPTPEADGHCYLPSVQQLSPADGWRRGRLHCSGQHQAHPGEWHGCEQEQGQ